MKIVSPQVEFGGLLQQVKTVMPEVFDNDGKFLNLVEGKWQLPGKPRDFVSPIDNSVLAALPMLDRDSVLRAFDFAKRDALNWARVDLDERKRKVSEAINLLKQHRELIGKLLI